MCMRLKDVLKILHYDTSKKPADRRAVLRQDKPTVGDDWHDEVDQPKQSKYLVYLVVFTFLFFLVTVGIALIIHNSDIDRTVSTSKIKIITQGASIADGGTVVPLSLRIANNNPVAIRDVKFLITYPPGTYKKEKSTTRLPTEEFSWDLIASGEVVTMRISPLFYGTVGEQKELQYYLEYQAEGSTQPTQINDKKYMVQIRSAPLVISKLQHTNPVAGKDMTITVGVRHNAAETVPRAELELVYPHGFTPTTFSAQPVNREKTRWRIRPLGPNEEQTISITGILQGQEDDEQSVIAYVHAAPVGEKTTVISQEDAVFSVNKSFLSIAMQVNRENTETITVSPGDTVNVNVEWESEDTAQIQDLVIIAKLSGTGLNESSIKPKRGYFNEVKKQIIWDKQQIPSFTTVGARADGSVSFSFDVLSNRVEFARAEKTIRISIDARARRVITGQTETIRNIAVGTVRVRSTLQAAANTLYASSAIQNNGPVPPQVGRRTSYVLNYFIKNDGNTLSDMVMRIPLARDVALTGEMRGLVNNEWEYDEDTHTLTITVPTLAPIGSQASRLFEIQVVIEPSSADLNQEIQLTKQASYEAYDTFVNEQFTGTLPPLTSRITAEPVGYRSGIVVE